MLRFILPHLVMVGFWKVPTYSVSATYTTSDVNKSSLDAWHENQLKAKLVRCRLTDLPMHSSLHWENLMCASPLETKYVFSL